MINVIILDSRLVEDEISRRWVCLLELENDGELWQLPAGASGDIAENELQAHFDDQAEELWRIAEEKRYEADVTLYLNERELLKRLLRLLLDEFNILREAAGLPPRTMRQIKERLRTG